MYYLSQKYSNAAFSLDSNRLTERRDGKEVANPTRAQLLRARSRTVGMKTGKRNTRDGRTE